MKKPGLLRNKKCIVFNKTNFHCAYCGKLLEIKNQHDWTIDHIIPRSKGGSNSIDNCLLACRSCNSSKGSKNLEEFRKYLQRKVFGAPSFDNQQLLWLEVNHCLDHIVFGVFKFYFEEMEKK
jgi:5-methylcytosine-specific restriction endonuclease McrA